MQQLQNDIQTTINILKTDFDVLLRGSDEEIKNFQELSWNSSRDPSPLHHPHMFTC